MSQIAVAVGLSISEVPSKDCERVLECVTQLVRPTRGGGDSATNLHSDHHRRPLLGCCKTGTGAPLTGLSLQHEIESPVAALTGGYSGLKVYEPYGCPHTHDEFSLPTMGSAPHTHDEISLPTMSHHCCC
jgi:hypothetical protein